MQLEHNRILDYVSMFPGENIFSQERETFSLLCQHIVGISILNFDHKQLIHYVSNWCLQVCIQFFILCSVVFQNEQFPGVWNAKWFIYLCKTINIYVD